MLGIPKAKLRPQNKTINPELSYLDRNGPFFYVLLSHEYATYSNFILRIDLVLHIFLYGKLNLLVA